MATEHWGSETTLGGVSRPVGRAWDRAGTVRVPRLTRRYERYTHSSCGSCMAASCTLYTRMTHTYLCRLVCPKPAAQPG